MASRSKVEIMGKQLALAGTQPHKSHLVQPNGFKKGRKKTGGRNAGTPNQITADIREAIVTACQMLGDFRTRRRRELPRRTPGLIGYMIRLGRDHPTTMGMLLRAALPRTIKPNAEHFRNFRTEGQARAEQCEIMEKPLALCGTEPHTSHAASASNGFKKGRAKTGGRKAGVRNRITTDIKEAIVTGCTMLGDFMRPEAELPQGTPGLAGYMVMLGRDHPATMAMLLRAVIPLTLTAKVEPLPDYPTEEEVRAKLAALGMPWHSTYHLEYHDPKLIEGKALREALENMPPE
jgi:hypothetical protein